MKMQIAVLIPIFCLCALPAVGDAPAGDDAPPRIPATRGVPALGRIIWPGQDLSSAQIRVYADERRTELVDTFHSGGPAGAFVLALNPGEYYLMALVDADGDGRLGPGDGIGFYGVTDPASAPRPLIVDEGTEALTFTLPISFRIAPDGRGLVPVQVQAPVPLTAEFEAVVTGRVEGGTGLDKDRFVILAPLAPETPARAVLVAEDGSFEMSAVPGSYHMLAIEKLVEEPFITRGDLFGVPFYGPEAGASLPTLRPREKQRVADVVIRLEWALAGDGRLRSGDGSSLGPRINLPALPAILTGTVTRLGEPLAGVHVRAYMDEDLSQWHYHTETDKNGRFCLGVSPGTYYLMARHDVDGDGATGPGDELGFLGVDAERLSARPEPVLLRPAEIRRDGNIPLVMVVDPQNKPVPLTAPTAPEEEPGDAADPATAEQNAAEAE